MEYLYLIIIRIVDSASWHDLLYYQMLCRLFVGVLGVIAVYVTSEGSAPSAVDSVVPSSGAAATAAGGRARPGQARAETSDHQFMVL